MATSHSLKVVQIATSSTKFTARVRSAVLEAGGDF